MKRSVSPLLFVWLFALLVALPLLATASGPGSLRARGSPAETGGPPTIPLTHPPGAAQPAPFTGLAGYIRDANTGRGLAGYVYLYDAQNPDVEYDAFANAAGYYTLTVPGPGTYQVYGTMIGYYRADSRVTIAAGEIGPLDFHLPAPLMSWTPDAISVTMGEGKSQNIPLVIRNTGSGDLLFRLDEMPSNRGMWPALPAPLLPTGVDPQVYADLAASPDGTTEILIVMAEQADLSAAHGISDWSARGHYVYNILQATAHRSQARTRGYLSQQGIAYEPHLSLNSLTLTAGRSTVDRLATLPEIGAIRPGYTYDIAGPPIQSAAAPEEIGWNVRKVEADRAWAEFGATGEGIVVASIDTGVEWDHEALKNQYRGWDGGSVDHSHNWWDPRGACEMAGYAAGEPCDNYWHGTHTMGTMAGGDLPADPLQAPNAIGLAPGAKWITCKGCEMVDGWPCSAFSLLECADFLLAPWDQKGQNADPDMRPHVINNSWGGEANDGWYSTVIAAWRAAGIFPAFSAGNEGPACSTVSSPGDYPQAFTTGATDYRDLSAPFSGRGPAQLGWAKPEVTAPGSGVRSSVPGNTYGGGSGTSMASPHSAGGVALIWSAQPELIGQVAQTAWLMMQTADPILSSQCGAAGPPNHVYGWGRINAYNAVSMALASNWGVEWLGLSQVSGTVEPGATITANVKLDSRNLRPHTCHRAELRIETNDPYQGIDILVPVELCVGAYIQKEVTPMHQAPGLPVTYTIVLGNYSEPATGVLVSDTLPPEVEFVWADPAGTYDEAAHKLIWADLTLRQGDRITATVLATIRADVEPYAQMTNTVHVRYAQAGSPRVAQASHYARPQEESRRYLPLAFRNNRTFSLP